VNEKEVVALPFKGITLNLIIWKGNRLFTNLGSLLSEAIFMWSPEVEW
jgi:hypothetical protein